MSEKWVIKLVDNSVYFWFEAVKPVAKFDEMLVISYFIHLAKIML